jgi:regulator of sigma E protease
VLNAANEQAVVAFLAGTIRFDQIHRVNAATVEAISPDAWRVPLARRPARPGRTLARAGGQLRERPLRMITTVLAFILTLGVLIVIHEYGHYRVAVACGVKVLRFSVGSAGCLWRRQATPESTEFVLCALPLGGYVRMLDEREGEVAPQDLSRAFNRKPLRQRAAIVAAGPAANLLLAVVLYAAAHWIGIDEPKAVLGPPIASSLAERAGLRAGDWVRAYSTDGVEWQDLRSLTELRWEVTQAVMRGERLNLMVTDRDGRGQRRVGLDLDTLPASEVDAKLMQSIGIGSAFSEPVLGEVRAGGPAAKAGLRAGDRVVSIDGESIADASRVARLIRASGNSGVAKPMRWRVQRGIEPLELTVTPSIVVENEQRVGRIEVFPGQPPEMVSGALRRLRRHFEGGVADLEHVGPDVEDARQDDHRAGLAEEPERAR